MKEKRNKLNIQEGQTETFHYEPTGGITQKEGVRRVAAYCRVSTLAEEQELSFETQSSYYKGLIEKDPAMVLVGIYGDQGFSGLHASRRKEFLRLIADCEADKVDIVLVKSISRFSRNTVECREYLERLKKHEDDVHVTLGHAAVVINMFRKLCMQMLKADTSVKDSLTGKRQRCAWSFPYALAVVKNWAFS